MSAVPAPADWSDALPAAACSWPAASNERAVEDRADCVHVHCVGLEQTDGVVTRLAELLSAEEHARAARLRGATLHRRFVVAHGALRVILAAHAQADPRALRFDTSGELHGKPRLIEPTLARAPRFNLSHSGEIALVAVSARTEIGVDVEQIVALDDLWSVARTVYTAREIEALRSQDAGRQLEAWYDTWTRKEAALKAVGKGFGIDPRGLEMLAPRYVPTTTSAAFAEAARDARWTIHRLEPAPGYAGALAVLGEATRTILKRWPCRSAAGPLK